MSGVVSSKTVKTHNKNIWLVVVPFTLLVIVIGFLLLKSAAQPALQVGSYTVSKSDYNNLVNQATKQGLTKTQAHDQIINDYKYQEAAKQANLKVPAGQIAQSVQGFVPTANNTTPNQWQLLDAQKNATQVQVNIKDKGGINGTLFLMAFSTSFVNYDSALPKPNGFGTSSGVASLQKYAQDQANKYHDQLSKGLVTASDALNSLSTDTKLYFPASGNGSFVFWVDNNNDSLSTGNTASRQLPSYAFDIAKATKTGSVSDVNLLSMDYGPGQLANGLSSPQPTAYYFMKIDTNAQPDPGYSNSFNTLLASVKVVDNEKVH